MKFRTTITIVAFAVPFSLAVAARAQAPGVVALTPSEMKFSTAGLAMAGMSQANLVGDPTKPGPYTVRLTYPDGFTLAPHSHPDAREVTILSGTWLTGYGVKFDEAKLKELPAGSFYTEPAKLPHFVKTKGSVMIQVSGVGPSARQFVDPPAGSR
jgi:quercetin dioxygenase-like cupin family protein